MPLRSSQMRGPCSPILQRRLFLTSSLTSPPPTASFLPPLPPPLHPPLLRRQGPTRHFGPPVSPAATCTSTTAPMRAATFGVRNAGRPSALPRWRRRRPSCPVQKCTTAPGASSRWDTPAGRASLVSPLRLACRASVLSGSPFIQCSR